MRVAILTLGSRGDVQPLVAFGTALGRQGHQVRLATHATFEPLVREHGLDFAPLAEGAIGRHQLSGEHTAEGRWWAKGQGLVPAWAAFLRDARSVARQRFADSWAACEDADVVVASNLAQVTGRQIAERLDVPLVRVLFHAPTYWMARSPSRPGVRAGRRVAWTAARPWLNRIRRDAVGWEPLGREVPFMPGDRRVALNLLPYSPSVFPPPDGPLEPTVVTGYWLPEATSDPAPPAELEAFLAAGPAPVYVGFGTQADDDPPATTRLIVDALRRAGRRGVLSRTPEALAGVELGDDMTAVASVSHQWLFGRCAAVAHHCGAGTIASALLAGAPTVAVPHFSDQFAWARLLRDAGACTAPLSRRRLTAERLADAIRAATADDAMRRRAADLGARIAAEDGVARAVEAFERHVAQPAGARAGDEVAA